MRLPARCNKTSRVTQTHLKEVGNHFIVVFKRKGVEEKVTEKVPEKVTENQQKIIKLISRNAHVTIADLAESVGISERKIKVNVAKLKKKNILRRIGPDKGGYWKVIK